MSARRSRQNSGMKTGSQGGGEEGRKSSGKKKTGKGAPLSPPRLPVEKNSADSTTSESVTHVVDQLRALEDARKDGAIELPGGERLNVTNLAKPFWPKLKLTKGDLIRYYATVAPMLLPAVADRPLVMKRFPNGVDGPAFYQQRHREEKPPSGVRIETLDPEDEPISEPGARRLIGGSLITLLYMTQIAAISQDPWFSRVQSPLEADYVALDLDPDDDATFAQVLDVARWIRDELHSLKVPAVPKTSGSSGLHIYIPLPPGTSYESGMLFCQIVATVVASRHPKTATVERTVKARKRGTVYVDYLQNILGKTLATAYSARASSFAGVSTPLDWKELDEAIDPRDYTITTAPERFAKVGDLWARLRKSKPANLEAVFKSTRATDCSSRRAAQRESDRNPLGGTRQELSRAVSTSRITAALGIQRSSDSSSSLSSRSSASSKSSSSSRAMPLMSSIPVPRVRSSSRSRSPLR